MNKKILVTGASGHIGNSLVRALLQSGKRVVAAVRGPKSERLFNSPQCEMVNIDLQDKHSTSKALQGTDTLYHTGTAFRDLASAPGSSGYDTCLRGNRNVMEAAAEAGIRRLVYISSLAALDRSAPLIHEGSWNPGMDNIYFRAETDAEKLAWSLADEFGLEMISALPSAAVGMNGAGINCGGMTLTMRLLKAVLEGTLAVDPGFHFNFIHVEDVVSGILAAAERGHPGERYLLANESAMSIREVVALAQEAFPERHIRTPVSLPSSMLWVIVAAMETRGGLDGTEAKLIANSLKEFTRREQCDTAKAQRELGFAPASPHTAVLRALQQLNRYNRDLNHFTLPAVQARGRAIN